ncbi:MAG: DNA-binding protein [Prochloraceae cyanobacterium]|nr:DNA-binding protein [Prochloraceae cyanobacterium]
MMNKRGSLETLALRLRPGSDVRRELEGFAKREKICAGAIIGAVGSLSKVCLRLANEETSAELSGKHELLTLSGTLGEDGVHLHLSVANSQGECIGGHLVYGCQVYTTLELIIVLIPELRFKRVFDSETGYKELNISPISEPE